MFPRRHSRDVSGKINRTLDPSLGRGETAACHPSALGHLGAAAPLSTPQGAVGPASDEACTQAASPRLPLTAEGCVHGGAGGQAGGITGRDTCSEAGRLPTRPWGNNSQRRGVFDQRESGPVGRPLAPPPPACSLPPDKAAPTNLPKPQRGRVVPAGLTIHLLGGVGLGAGVWGGVWQGAVEKRDGLLAGPRDGQLFWGAGSQRPGGWRPRGLPAPPLQAFLFTSPLGVPGRA